MQEFFRSILDVLYCMCEEILFRTLHNNGGGSSNKGSLEKHAYNNVVEKLQKCTYK